MGAWVVKHYTDPEVAPDHTADPVFDQHAGFSGKRRERIMQVTEAEMDSVGLLAHQRDYCAHKLIDMIYCKRRNFPLLHRCNPHRHDYVLCQRQDFYMRTMEFERERRLLMRQRRKAHAQAKANAEFLAE